MAEMMAHRNKSKTKERCNEIFGDIPALPDISIIEIKDSTKNIEEDTNEHFAAVDIDVDIVNEDLYVPEDTLLSTKKEISDLNNTSTLKENAKKIKVETIEPVILIKPVAIERLYPSITKSLSMTEDITEKKESLDIVSEVVRRPEAPIEEWELPKPLPERELMRYYENSILESLEDIQTTFKTEMKQQMHPLVDLLERWERSVNKMWQMKERMKIEREICSVRGKDLWKVTEKNGVKEMRCKDNIIVRKAYVYDEAIYDEPGAEQLREGLGNVSDQVMEELCVSQYEASVNKAQIDNYLVKVRESSIIFVELRKCIAVLMMFLRRPQAHISCKKCLQDWTIYLGSSIADTGDCNDRLYLLWQLLHAPVGVGEWGAALVQSLHGEKEMDLAVAYLAMILSSNKHRDELLFAYNPTTNPEESAWTLVDSEGEEDGNLSNSWFLLRESDLTAFLTQVPIKAVFQFALDIDPYNNIEVSYDPRRSCHPNNLIRLMAFCHRIIQILNSGLDQHDFARYKTFNKRISRLIKHTIQFLTDHLEIVLGTSMIPIFHEYFPDNTRLLILAQYEAVFETALLSLLFHRRHGNWQSLSDLPWRMLSPSRKELFLYRLIDPQLGSQTTNINQMVSCLQSTIETVQHSESLYLLTALANFATECRTVINTEYKVLSTITNLLFQTCYVHPITRSTLSKVGRELLSSICLQHPHALSFIIEAVKLWHPSVGQMGLFLFRELPFCLMIPTDIEFKLFCSWIYDNPPNSVCNQLGRHVLTNLNWGFANTEETFLYLPLSLHQKMADFTMQSYKKHAIDSKSGQWLLDSMKLVTSLWWNQESMQNQCFHAWCLGMIIRLRLHPSSRLKVYDKDNIMPSPIINTSDWIQSITDAQQDKCSNPIAMFLAVATRLDTNLSEITSLKILQNLVSRHQQYRLSLELIYNILVNSTTSELNCLVGNDTFMSLWRQITHADDTYYNMVKSLITKQFPGSVLSCISNSFSSSLIIGQDDINRQETMMRFFIRSVLNQSNWSTDHCFLWLLDKLLELNSALDLKAGSQELYTTTKAFTDKQLQDASKRSGLAQIFRLGSTFTTLLSQLAVGEYFWFKGYIIEAEARIEDELRIWPSFLYKIFIRKKKDTRTIVGALSSACKHLKLAVPFSVSCLAIIQAAQTISTCPPEHYAMIKLASVFFPRYLGLARTWDQSLPLYGSGGHVIFQDDTCLQILQQTRTAIGATKTYVSSELNIMQQNQDTDIGKLTQLQKLRDSLDTFLLWIDEPRLHLVEFPINGLPGQYRADLLEKLRCGYISSDDLNLPKRLLLISIKNSASLWATRHDLDLTFVRLAEKALRKVPIPITTSLFQRFNRQTSFEALNEPTLNLYVAPNIPMQAMTSSTHMLEFISGYLSTMYQCAAKYKANKNYLSDLDKKYLTALSRYYEPNTVKQNFQLPCTKGQHCTGAATINLIYQIWTTSPEVITEVTRNRQDYNTLVDEIFTFANLDQLVKAVVCLQNLIISLSNQIHHCKSEDETKKVIDCGMALFFHLGRQVNKETQTYPPHRHMVSSCMETLGLTFVPYARTEAHKLLQGILENELLVNIYGPHFNPNIDDSNTAHMYSQVVNAYKEGKCNSEVTFIILNKFNMNQFMEHSLRLASRMNMVCTLCDAIATIKPEDPKDNQVSGIHVLNLEVLLITNYSKCLSKVLDKFLKICQESKLGPPFWKLILKCSNENIKEHGELSLTIDEIKQELETFGSWLNNLRFTDPVSKKDGLYVKFGKHATQITEVYSLLLDSLLFKICRSAKENIVPWREVISVGWDILLKVYIPWLQAFPSLDNQQDSSICIPWRIQDKDIANSIIKIVVIQLNSFLANIPNEESQGFLLHCVLIWIINGLLVHKQLQSKPYHDTYYSELRLLRWDALKPSADCIKLILEFYSRSYNSEQSMILLIEVASRVRWSKIPHLNDVIFKGLIFEMIVTMICKTRSVFKVQAMEPLADALMEIHWNELTVLDYRKGMEQLIANLEPKIILSNPSTIEGKVIRLLNHAAGQITLSASSLSNVMEKQAIYISIVVKLLTVAFSFTQTKNSKGKQTEDLSQIKLFHLRVSTLFTEIESVVIQVKDDSARNNLSLSVLSEALALFKNHTIASHALDPVVGWIQESHSSPLILPFLIAIYRWPPHIPSMVVLANQLIEAYLLSDNSDASQGSWTTVTACARLTPELEQQYLRESVRNNCMLCLVQQLLLSLPFINDTNSESWQNRIIDWLEETHPYGTVPEQGAILLIFLYLQLLLTSSSTNAKPGRSFENMIQLLLKLSQSKKSSGLLGMVGMGKKSSFSFQFRMMCRSIMVFLQSQLPSNNVLRTIPNQPGGLTSQNMTVSSRLPGEPLPTNKTLQNLEWLKSQRQSKELVACIKPVLEMSITYICDPSHSIMDSIGFMRLLCQQLWPQEKLLRLIHPNLS